MRQRTKFILILIAIVAIAIVIVIALRFFSGIGQDDIEVIQEDISSIGISADGAFGDSGDFISGEPIDVERADEIPRLRQISNFPVAGAMIFEDDEENVVIRFMARETGHIYETTANSVSQRRISNTTIPKIQNAFWSEDGEELLIQYIDDASGRVDSFYAKLEESENISEEGQVSVAGNFLPRGISSFDIQNNKDAKNKLFYLIGEFGGAIGTISNMDGSGKTQIFNSKLSEWIIEWTNGNIVAFTTKSTSSVAGYLYFLNSRTGGFEKIIGDIRGLQTRISPNAKQALLSRSSSSGISLSIFDVGKKEIKTLSINTFAEKCVWSAQKTNTVYCGVPRALNISVEYPDEWLQGLISFSDDIWMIDTGEGISDLLIKPQDSANVDIDIIKPILSPNEDYLLFVNKKDSTLWSLRLE